MEQGIQGDTLLYLGRPGSPLRISLPVIIGPKNEENEGNTKKKEEEDIDIYNSKNREEKQVEKKRRNIIPVKNLGLSHILSYIHLF